MRNKRTLIVIVLFLVAGLGCVKKNTVKLTSRTATFLTPGGNNYGEYNKLHGQGFFATCWAVSLAGLVEQSYYRANSTAREQLLADGTRRFTVNPDDLFYHRLAYEVSELFRIHDPDKVFPLLNTLVRTGTPLESFIGGFIGASKSDGSAGALDILRTQGIVPTAASSEALSKLESDASAEASIARIMQDVLLAARNPTLAKSLASSDKVKSLVLDTNPLFQGLSAARTSIEDPDSPGRFITPLDALTRVASFDPDAFVEFDVRDQDALEIALIAARHAIADQWIVPMAIGLDVESMPLKVVKEGSAGGSRLIRSPSAFKLPASQAALNPEDRRLKIDVVHVMNIVAIAHKGQAIDVIKSPKQETLEANLQKDVTDISSIIVQNSLNPLDTENGLYAGVTREYLDAVAVTQKNDPATQFFSFLLPRKSLEWARAGRLAHASQGVDLESRDGSTFYVGTSCRDLKASLANPLSQFGGKYNAGFWNLMNQRAPVGGTINLRNTEGDWIFHGYRSKAEGPGMLVFESKMELEAWKKIGLDRDTFGQARRLASREKCWRTRVRLAASGSAPDLTFDALGPVRKGFLHRTLNAAENLSRRVCEDYAASTGRSKNQCLTFDSDEAPSYAGCAPFIFIKSVQSADPRTGRLASSQLHARIPRASDQESWFSPAEGLEDALDPFDLGDLSTDFIMGRARSGAVGANCR